MKKVYLYLLLACLSASRLRAQEGVIYKIKYQPGRTYQSNTNLGVKLLINVSGNKDIIDKLASQGITMPVNVNVSLGLNGNIKSGTIGADNTFPLKYDYQLGNFDVTANGKNIPIPQNKMGDIKMYAHVNPDGIIKIDSAQGKKVNDTTEKKMQQMMSMFQRTIKFPDHPLKPGDTFTQDMPFNIPIQGMGGDNKIDINVTYKLLSVTGGKATFAITQNMSMNLQMKQGTVKLTGTGTGTMVYSEKDNFPTSFNSTMAMKLSANIANVVVDGTATITTSQTTVIN